MAVAAQIFNPVKWDWKADRTSATEATLIITAKCDAGWHIYAQNVPDGGPIPTTFDYKELNNVKLNGKTSEPKGHTEMDKAFGIVVTSFEGDVVFKQKIKITTDPASIGGEIGFMVCNDERCLPPDYIPFKVEIPAFTGEAPKENAVPEPPVMDSQGDTGKPQVPVGDTTDRATVPDNTTPAVETELPKSADTSWVGIFIAGFLGGLLALLTPCVFPMIPLTVSFFTKQSKTKAMGIRNAVLYGLSIIGIYVLLGFGVTAIFGADALNALSTNVWFNIFFFVLLVVFAISFLGAFEITLPSSWVNKADQASERGGLIGIFFMAFTLSLVSFSCTGPIIGTLLVEAAVNGGVMGPIMGMTGFSMALALPFGLFAAFPGWLNTLPKSGGWLNSVKVVLGLLELALALKFLSNADLVVQANIITREVFLAFWIAIFGSLALYLFGFIRFPHDSPVQNLSIPRFLFGLMALIFTIYLVPGLWGAPLKIISGFPPPQFYSESPQGLISASSGGGGTTAHGSAKVGDGHCPHDLPCFHDYETGLAHAKKVGKPVMLDFTGWACVNCRKMEEQVWSDPQVLKRLAEDYVLISLYVDEKTELPKDQQIEVTIGDRKKTLRSVGNKWSHMQAERFGTNSQPYYVVLDHNEKQIGPPAAYDPDIQKYINWLDAGLKGFKEGM